MLFAFVWFSAAGVVDEAAKQLAADVKLAMKRADLSLDYISRVLSVPVSRLSDQLNGKTPFTFFWRFSHREIRDLTEFWPEFMDIQADRMNRLLVRADLGRLIARLDESLAACPKRMVKAALPVQQKAEAV